ncbi:uncharacterized protein LOC107046389 [Diachasma alloeum]|uniref:uncharacterized protein LOC107046389 n=1 Tax=Diachasma alloeum TaxID=454923 RepID=UPI00073846E8|nr:uncharacterized protein LOC107046389 [Diachasma alloeum]
MSEFFYPGGKIPVNYDIAMAFDTSVDGDTNFGGACLVSPSQKIILAVGVIEDSGGFSDVLTATNELGHL